MAKSNEGKFTHSKKRLVAAISSGTGRKWMKLDRYKQVDDSRKISIWLLNQNRKNGDLKLETDGKKLVIRRFSGREIATINFP